MKRTYSVKTLGCKANLYDSQILEETLQKQGWQRAGPGIDPDICIVNSCTVTDEADRQSRKTAIKAAKKNEKTRVIYTGCGAEVTPESAAKSAGIDFVVGNQDKHRLVELVENALGQASDSDKNPNRIGTVLGEVRSYGELRSRHPMDREWGPEETSFARPPARLDGDSRRTRSFIKIQDGCDSFCTYCIIPYGRGPGRSLNIEAVVEQVQSLVSTGTQEIVMTGTNIGDYGSDWNEGRPALENLVQAVLEQTELKRLRLSSLDPVEITPRLLELQAGSPRFCAHFHVSLQSPHSRILKLMKRKYAASDVAVCLNAIAATPAPVGGAFVGMDVITGFPGETREEFEWGYEQLKNLPWSRLHVFPYSERKGTPATRLVGSVAQQERVRRAKLLRDLSLERMTALYASTLGDCQKHGRRLDRVLLESPVEGPPGSQKTWVLGHASNYLRVLVPFERLEDAQAHRNTVVTVIPEQILVDRASSEVSFQGRLA